jgi:hypothetical protein
MLTVVRCGGKEVCQISSDKACHGICRTVELANSRETGWQATTTCACGLVIQANIYFGGNLLPEWAKVHLTGGFEELCTRPR